MDKEALRERIKSLPLFELRRVRIRTDATDQTDEWVEPVYSRAVCRINENIPYAFVGAKYDLIQFKDVFTPILDSVDVDVEGRIMDFGGFAQLIMFPDMEELKDEGVRFGLVAANSVDCSSAVIIKFCIAHDDDYIMVPTKVAGLKRKHTGKVKGIVKDYVNLVSQVRLLWKNIVTQFPKYQIVKQLDPMKEGELEFKAVLKSLRIGPRLGKTLAEKYEHAFGLGRPYTLWDLFMDGVGAVTERNYKSDVHKQRRIDQLSEAVFKYATALGI